MIETRWIIILAIAITEIVALQCDDHTHIIDGCTCQPSLEGDDEFHCPTSDDSMFVLRIRRNEYVKVECRNTPDWSEFPQNGSNIAEHPKALSIRMCSLPKNMSFAEIGRRFGGTDLELLIFQSFGNISNTLTSRHLEDLTNLKRLTFSSNALSRLTKEHLRDMHVLDWLDLRDNEVKLALDVFEYTPTIRVLELGRNSIDHIEPGTFAKLSNLTLLNLWRNQLDNLQSDTFNGLTSVTSLDLNTNGLTKLPPNIFHNLTNLETLNLFGNNFTTLPYDLLHGLNKLKIFNLYDNKRNLTLPNGFFRNMSSLQSVKLRRNGFINLTEDLFWGVPTLTNVSLERNYLVTLPQDIFKDAEELYILDLSFNDLETLPDYLFSNNQKLTYLDLSKNRLSTISRYLFDGLVSLTHLNMEQNNLKVIHDFGLTYLQNLREARFGYNELTLKPIAFRYQDEYGTMSPFHRCKLLENLYLEHNNISEMFNDWIVSSPNLRKLYLQYNNFSYISIEDLQFVSNDKIDVNLTYNNIHRVILTGAEGIATKQIYPRNVIIDVGNNPIICDCYLYDFLRYLEGRMSFFVQNYVHIKPGDLKCSGPEWLQNVSIANLKSKNYKCLIDDSPNNIACLENCSCWLRQEDKAFLIDCSNRNLTQIDHVRLNHLPIPKQYHIELNLTGNSLTQIPHVLTVDSKNLTSLLLSHNNIYDVSANLLPKTLEVLKLDNNNITALDLDTLEFMKNSSRLTKLTLHHNPWKCNCDAKEFLSFIQARSVEMPDLLDVKCDGMNTSLSKMTTSSLCPEETMMIVGVSLAIALMGLVIGTIAALYYRYQREIKVWLYAHQWCLWFVTEDELDKDKTYDAFISYSHKDEEFVMNELVSKLESGPRPFKLCIHIRNWQVGEWIPTQIVRSVEDSKRTIVVLSPNFLESVWGRMEFRAAHSQALSEGRARVILIIYGEIGPTDNLDPELKAYLSMNTYVKWGDPWFWDKLRYAMPHPVEFTKGGMKKKIFEKHQHCITINGDKNELICPPGVPESPLAVTTPPADSLKVTIV